jgi:hypothetical protein
VVDVDPRLENEKVDARLEVRSSVIRLVMRFDGSFTGLVGGLPLVPFAFDT